MVAYIVCICHCLTLSSFSHRFLDTEDFVNGQLEKCSNCHRLIFRTHILLQDNVITLNKCQIIIQILAHLSQRLVGELIVYQCFGVLPSSFTMLKHLRNSLANQSQILCGAFMGRGDESFLRHLGHMTNMAATPIYGKNPSKIFSGTS